MAHDLIPKGLVDRRPIQEVKSEDLIGFKQCHFFAGIGGWAYAARLARWPKDAPIWTGSCPCQPFSIAGRGNGSEDPRHLWPVWLNLIRECRPSTIFGEQVAAAVSKGWIDGVFDDLEENYYSCGAAIIPACAVDAPHRRDRLWFVANSDSGHGEFQNEAIRARRNATDGSSEAMANPDSNNSFWWSGALQVGRNALAGKAETSSQRERTQWRIKPGLSLLANGIPGRVGRLCAYGNAIVPQVAAEFIVASRLAIQDLADSQERLAA